MDRIKMGQIRVVPAGCNPQWRTGRKRPSNSGTETPAKAVVTACEDLMRILTRPEGCPLEDLQGAAEYLLDKIKVAKTHKIRKVRRAKIARLADKSAEFSRAD